MGNSAGQSRGRDSRHAHFDNAAGYETVRREISALRKIHHPNVVEVFWADKTNVGDWYLITEFIDGEPLDEFTSGKKLLRDREAVDVGLDVLDALVAFHPDAARLKRLDAKRREGELSVAEFHEWMDLHDKRPGPPRHQTAQRYAHSHRSETA